MHDGFRRSLPPREHCPEEVLAEEFGALGLVPHPAEHQDVELRPPDLAQALLVVAEAPAERATLVHLVVREVVAAFGREAHQPERAARLQCARDEVNVSRALMRGNVMKAPTVVDEVVGAGKEFAIEYRRAVNGDRHASLADFLTCPFDRRRRLIHGVNREPLPRKIDGVARVAAADVQRSLAFESTRTNPLVEVFVRRKHEDGAGPLPVVVEGLPVGALGDLELQFAISGGVGHHVGVSAKPEQAPCPSRPTC